MKFFGGALYTLWIIHSGPCNRVLMIAVGLGDDLNTVGEWSHHYFTSAFYLLRTFPSRTTSSNLPKPRIPVLLWMKIQMMRLSC